MFYVRLSVFLVGLLLVTGGLSGQEKSSTKKNEPSATKKATPSKGRKQLPPNWGRIGLSTEQKRKVYSVQAKYDEEIDKLEAQIKELKDKMRKERLDVLTVDQKKKLDDIIRASPGDNLLHGVLSPWVLNASSASRPVGFLPGPDIAAKLAALGETPVLRMIDGLPAFPNEVPDPEWRELRVGLVGEMVTLRKDNGALRCVIWGTGDAALQTAWERCCEAAATAGDGQIM